MWPLTQLAAKTCPFVTLWPVNSSEGVLRFIGLLSLMVIMFIVGNGPPLLEKFFPRSKSQKTAMRNS